MVGLDGGLPPGLYVSEAAITQRQLTELVTPFVQPPFCTAMGSVSRDAFVALTIDGHH